MGRLNAAINQNNQCYNDDPCCSTWSQNNKCTANTAYMSKYCRRSCNYCQVPNTGSGIVKCLTLVKNV